MSICLNQKKFHKEGQLDKPQKVIMPRSIKFTSHDSSKSSVEICNRGDYVKGGNERITMNDLLYGKGPILPELKGFIFENPIEIDKCVEGRMQSIRNGLLFVRLDSPQALDNALFEKLRSDLSCWAHENGISLKLDSNGKIGRIATMQFQKWYQDQFPGCPLGLYPNGTIDSKTIMQLDVALGRKDKPKELSKSSGGHVSEDFEIIDKQHDCFKTQESINDRICKIESNRDKQRQINKGLDNLNSETIYFALSLAESGGEEDPFVRTNLKSKIPSSAYGPVQITGTLAQDALDNGVISPSLMKYANEFVDQSEKFLKARDNNRKYGLGGKGDLHSKQEEYKNFAIDIISWKMSDSVGVTPIERLNNFIKKWHGEPLNEKTKEYYAKIQNAVLSSVVVSSVGQAHLSSDEG